MTKICELYEYINRIAPFDSAQTWDNSGLLLGDADLPCHCVLLALDITEDTVKQAKECSADLVITHHPVIFRPLSALSYHTPIAELISSKISVISAHTNLDIAVDGVNDALCRALNLQDLTSVKETPFLKLGTLPAAMKASEFAAQAARLLKSDCTSYTRGEKLLHTVAVCSGAGGEFFKEVVESGADAFFTGELKYHELLEFQRAGVAVIQAGHRETERVYKEDLAKKLSEQFPQIPFYTAQEENLLTGV